jgi:rod shape-determining protein MreC
MQLLFLFLSRYRTFFTFFLLEFLCGWLIINNNNYQSAAFFSSSNQFVAYIDSKRNYVANYFLLPTINEGLARENEKLISELMRLKIDRVKYDSAFLPQYEYVAAKVVNNSLFRSKNYLTIDKGKQDGVAVGMGIVSSFGVVGKVKTVTDHYSTVTSLLHNEIQVASRIKKNNIICTTKWDMLDYREADLLEVGRHVDLKVNDTIVSSGYSQVYPENYPIGAVKSVSVNKNNSFLKVKMTFFTDFSALVYVYVIKNKRQQEIDSLQTISITDK